MFDGKLEDKIILVGISHKSCDDVYDQLSPGNKVGKILAEKFGMSPEMYDAAFIRKYVFDIEPKENEKKEKYINRLAESAIDYIYYDDKEVIIVGEYTASLFGFKKLPPYTRAIENDNGISWIPDPSDSANNTDKNKSTENKTRDEYFLSVSDVLLDLAARCLKVHRAK